MCLCLDWMRSACLGVLCFVFCVLCFMSTIIICLSQQVSCKIIDHGEGR